MPAGDHVDRRRVVAFIAMVFGMFMAILDIQIVSASLAEIQAGLSAGADEVAWVQTSYLIAEVIMIPLSGTLAHILSTRVLYTISAAGFTIASILASTATNIDQMIVYRTLQGFIGGAMIPSVFAAAYTIFPPSKRGVITPVIGLIATLAPTIGPTVGGFISDTMSWHWLFLVNVIPGVIVASSAWLLIDFDEPDLGLAKRFDWWGLAGMAGFLGGLEYLLEEGPTRDWLSDPAVAFSAILMASGALLFFARAFMARYPIVELKAFRDVNFAFGSLFSFVLGMGLYGLVYLYPVYLARIRGYDAMMIGNTMFVSGLAMFLTAPIAGRLSMKLDPRMMLLAGFSLFAVGTWMMTRITADWDFNEILVPQILRGVSLMLCMVPITNLALGTLPPDRLKNASGLFNVTRNLGGAVGLALINTALINRSDMHYARLAESVNWANPAAVDQLAGMARNFAASGIDGVAAATRQMAGLVHREASVMAFSDVFFLLTVLFGVLALLALVMRKPSPAAAAAPAH